jgi:NDP-sugar pyrophosphorylase family protein
MREMQVVILAGGLGTRLRPITEKIPKPMVPVRNEPFLHWQLLDLKQQGYRRVLLLVAYLGEQIEAHFGDGRKWGLEIEYAYEPEPLGTGGALKNALPKLDEKFILLNGDSFLHAPLGAMEECLGTAEAVVSTYDNRVATPVIPNLKVREGLVIDYKKDAGREQGFDRIDSGVYLLKRDLVARYPDERFMLADLWPPLIARGSMAAFAVDERFYDIGTIERLKEFEEKIGDYFPHAISN